MTTVGTTCTLRSVNQARGSERMHDRGYVTKEEGAAVDCLDAGGASDGSGHAKQGDNLNLVGGGEGAADDAHFRSRD